MQVDFLHYDAIVAWLKIILFERFGRNFDIHVVDDQYVRLSLSDSIAHIDIKRDSFFYGVQGMPGRGAQIWHPLSEGFSEVISARLPAPGVDNLPDSLIMLESRGARINYDILGLTYWMLSRVEEIHSSNLDNHGRFPAISSHSYRRGYLDRPVVDEWLCILSQVMHRVWPQLELKRNSFALRVSHDVDGPSRYGFRSIRAIARIAASQILKKRDPKTAWLAAYIRLNSDRSLHPDDPSNTFDWIMEQSELRGLKSAFYFICGRTDSSKDADYEPEHPAIRDLMRRIHARGHEIGLHPSYNTYQNPDAIRTEAARLRRICAEEGISQDQWGGRMHYLRWEQPTTLRAWNDAGMAYDSTLTYADRPGFRCGTCYEYPAFDPLAGEILAVRIRPLIAMECTVTAQRYLGLGLGVAALDKFLELKNACKAVNGTFTLLWHNSLLATEEERRLYTKVLDS